MLDFRIISRCVSSRMIDSDRGKPKLLGKPTTGTGMIENRTRESGLSLGDAVVSHDRLRLGDLVGLKLGTSGSDAVGASRGNRAGESHEGGRVDRERGPERSSVTVAPEGSTRGRLRSHEAVGRARTLREGTLGEGTLREGSAHVGARLGHHGGAHLRNGGRAHLLVRMMAHGSAHVLLVRVVTHGSAHVLLLRVRTHGGSHVELHLSLNGNLDLSRNLLGNIVLNLVRNLVHDGANLLLLGLGRHLLNVLDLHAVLVLRGLNNGGLHDVLGLSHARVHLIAERSLANGSVLDSILAEAGTGLDSQRTTLLASGSRRGSAAHVGRASAVEAVAMESARGVGDTTTVLVGATLNADVVALDIVVMLRGVSHPSW